MLPLPRLNTIESGTDEMYHSGANCSCKINTVPHTAVMPDRDLSLCDRPQVRAVHFQPHARACVCSLVFRHNYCTKVVTGRGTDRGIRVPACSSCNNV